MPWCPKCKNEYREGVTVCADCGEELEESLTETRDEPLMFGEQEQMERLKEFLHFNGIHSAHVSHDIKDEVYELFVSGEERRKAALAVDVFLKEEKEKVKTEDEVLSGKDSTERLSMTAPGKGVYQTSAKRAEENRASAYLLLIIGSIGLIVIILIFTGIIPLAVNIMNRYMICSVMGVLFVLFVVMGSVSMKSSKILAQKAESENNLTSEITKWCEENLTAETVDEGLFEDAEDESEESRYFKRVEKMKKQISHQFLNLDEGFLDSFTDDYYPHIFE
ncbi:MAG: hypothetical protein GX235_05890 [Clostridiales bacterium]|nr:hypothetical protein [Clostridiales bacterium]